MQVTPVLHPQTRDETVDYLQKVDQALEYGPAFFASGLFDVETEMDAIRGIEVHVNALVAAADNLGIADELGIPDQWRQPVNYDEVRAGLELQRALGGPSIF